VTAESESKLTLFSSLQSATSFSISSPFNTPS
jgi:hypothetical protein